MCMCGSGRGLQYHRRLRSKDFIFHISPHSIMCAGLELHIQIECFFRQCKTLPGKMLERRIKQKCKQRMPPFTPLVQQRDGLEVSDLHTVLFICDFALCLLGCSTDLICADSDRDHQPRLSPSVSWLDDWARIEVSVLTCTPLSGQNNKHTHNSILPLRWA